MPLPHLSSLPPLLSHLDGHLKGMLMDLHRMRETMTSQIEQQIDGVSQLMRNMEQQAMSAHVSKAAPVPVAPTIHSPEKLMRRSPKMTSVFLAAAEPETIDPDLEETTLSELNEALASAFSEIAARGGMLVKP